MIITIDGPSGTGKSTVARLLAKKLKFSYFDSGALYRSLAWYAQNEHVDFNDELAMQQMLSSFSFRIEENEEEDKHYFVAEKEVTNEIRSSEISKLASQLAAIAIVREKMLPIQREYVLNRDVVFEGRDMGSVVFPNADLKIYLTATEKVRAKRRWLDLQVSDPKISFTSVLESVEERDRRDKERSVCPLLCPKDAKVLDTTKLTIPKVIRTLMQWVKKEQKKKKASFLYRIVLQSAYLFFRLFYRMEIYGRENLPKGQAILASNHVSFYDPPIVSSASGLEVFFLAKESLFTIPLFGLLIRKINALPIKKNSSDVSTFKMSLKALKEGKKILLFPEGARSRSGEIQKILPGIGFLASMAKCPVVPVYVHGAYEIWPRGKKFPKLFGKIICVFGKPIILDFADKDRKEVAAQLSSLLRTKLQELKKWSENDCQGELP